MADTNVNKNFSVFGNFVPSFRKYVLFRFATYEVMPGPRRGKCRRNNEDRGEALSGKNNFEDLVSIKFSIITG